MKRFNYSERGRGGRPQGGRVDGGPLMTEHLTIRNLDEELEILRRKREGIRRQQELLSMETLYERKRQYEPQQSNYNNFPNMYDNVWESSPPKRFNDFPPSKVWSNRPLQDGPRPLMQKPIDSNYIPPFNNSYNQGPRVNTHVKPIVHPILKQGVGQRILRSAPNVRRNFNPTRIVKNNKPPVPNKLKSNPMEERKNLIAKTVSPKAPTTKAPSASPAADPMFFHENTVPTQQMTGRLELALGNIVKEIKTDFADHAKFSLLANTAYQRIMKQEIRDRIRKVMVGQSIGAVSQIVAKYREKFPKETDKEIVDLVLKAKDPKTVTVIESDDPEEFFKTNINAIVDKKLEEMFFNLIKIYGNGHQRASLAYTPTPDTKTKDSPPTKEQSEETSNIVKGLAGKHVTLEEKNALRQFYSEIIENVLDEKLPKALLKNMKHCLKVLDMDYQYRYVKYMTIKRIKDSVKNKKMSTDVEPLEKQTIEEKGDSDENKVELDQKESIKDSDQKGEEDHSESQEDTLEKSEETNSTAKAVVADEKPVKSVPTTPMPKVKESLASPKTPSTPGMELPFYVKLIGRPKLPTKAAIHDFLKSYRPASIKKHKSINNLLVIGFNNEEDYNKIITATETVVGNITILIKASEKVAGKDNESNNPETPKEVEMKETEPIKNELDEQIDDLLSSIRKADEGNGEAEKPVKTNGDAAKESKDSESDTKPHLEPVKEVSEDGDAQESEKSDKGPTANVKESGRSTPVRASSRLANVTPSSIRTRRASRLIQD